jgi:hypothetical protein
MELEDFLKIVPHDQQAKIRESTLRLWCHIYSYIEKQGFADTADDREFTDYVKVCKEISAPAIMAHLRRMANCGLLTGHPLAITGGRHEGIFGAFFNAGPDATRMLRYTLPGKEVPLRLKTKERSERLSNSHRRIMEQNEREGPKEVSTVHDVENLLSWLRRKQERREAITSEQNERLTKLVADASAILRNMDGNIQKLYIGAAIRSNLDPVV